MAHAISKVSEEESGMSDTQQRFYVCHAKVYCCTHDISSTTATASSLVVPPALLFGLLMSSILLKVVSLRHSLCAPYLHS